MKQRIWGLTIHQPWAAAIVHGSKRVENREWRPNDAHIGDYLAIHAGKKVDNHWQTDHFVYDVMVCEFGRDQLITSAIVGIAVLGGFVQISDDPWFFGPWGWVLRDVVPIDPVPCSGKQGLWSLPPGVLVQVRANYQKAKMQIEVTL